MKSVKFSTAQQPAVKPQKDIIPAKYRLEEPKTHESVTYSVPPGRVRRLIGRLAKTEIVPINDAKFISKLKESLDAEYDKECNIRMKKREKSENARIRELCINGVMEPPEELVEDLKNSPIYRINKTIAAVKEKISNKEKIGGFSKMPVRPLTPIEPFSDEYKNYFLRRHLYGSAEPGKSTMTIGGGHVSVLAVPAISEGVGSPAVLSPKTSESTGLEKNDKERTRKIKFQPSKSGQDMLSRTSRKSGVEIGPDIKTSIEKVPIEPVKIKSKVKRVIAEGSETVEEGEEEGSEEVEQVDVEKEGAEKMALDIKPSIIQKPDDLAPFKPFVSNLVSQVNAEAESKNMFEVGSDVLQTFNRQAKAAEQLLKNKARADKNKPPPDMP